MLMVKVRCNTFQIFPIGQSFPINIRSHELKGMLTWKLYLLSCAIHYIKLKSQTLEYFYVKIKSNGNTFEFFQLSIKTSFNHYKLSKGARILH